MTPISYVLLASLFAASSFMVHKHIEIIKSPRYYGEVVGHENRNSGDGAAYALVVRYTKDAVAHQFTTALASNPADKEIGERVVVIERENMKPQILSFGSIYFIYWFWLCFTILFSGIHFGPMVFDKIYLK